MFRAMQTYREGSRTFYNAITMRNFKTMKGAIGYAKRKAKGIPYVTQGVKIVWTPFKNWEEIVASL